VRDPNPKDRIGRDKAPMSTVPANVLIEVGTAMMEGALKYGRHNFRAADVRASVYYDAGLRHLMAWWEGENNDPDSGVSHLTKAIAGLVVLRDAMMNDRLNDDRPPKLRPLLDWMGDNNARARRLVRLHPEPKPPYTEECNGYQEED